MPRVPIAPEPESLEERRANFRNLISALVKDGLITRNQEDYGTPVSEVSADLRDIAEEELSRQGL